MENIEFIVYYKTADKEYRCYNYKTSEHNYIYSLPNNISNFYLPSKTKQKYQASDVDLKNYAHQLLKDRNEVLNITKNLSMRDEDGDELTYEEAVDTFPELKSYLGKYEVL